jgi:predicted DNA-binding transcriptional regulator AlpA
MTNKETRDELVPDPEVCREFSITSMTLYRWDHDPELGFPPPVRIRKRKFRSRRALEAFKARMLAEAVTRNKAA